MEKSYFEELDDVLKELDEYELRVFIQKLVYKFLPFRHLGNVLTFARFFRETLAEHLE